MREEKMSIGSVLLIVAAFFFLDMALWALLVALAVWAFRGAFG